MGGGFKETLETQHAVVYPPHPQLPEIAQIILMRDPGLARALLGEPRTRPLQIAGGEIGQRLFRLAFRQGRRRRTIALGAHKTHQPAQITRDHFDLEGPRGIEIAEQRDEIGHALVHAALVEAARGDLDRRAVDGQRDVAEPIGLQPRRRDHDVGLEHAPGSRAHSLGREGFDAVGDDLQAALAHGVKIIAVERDAQPFVPGRIARREIGELRPGSQRLARKIHEIGLGLGRVLAHPAADQRPEHGLGLAHDAVRGGGGEPTAKGVGERRAGGTGKHVGRGTLQQRDVGALGERRRQSDRRGAAADHQHFAPRDVETLRPELRMHDFAPKGAQARQIGAIGAVIAKISGADRDMAASDVYAPLWRVGLQGPQAVARIPRGGEHAGAKADRLVDAKILGGAANIGEDRGAVGDGVAAGPGLKTIAEREHVGIGAQSGIAEQIPCAAQRVSRLQDREARPRGLALQRAGGADPREPGADDDDVQRFAHRAFAGVVTHKSAGKLTSQQPVRRAPTPRLA